MHVQAQTHAQPLWHDGRRTYARCVDRPGAAGSKSPIQSTQHPGSGLPDRGNARSTRAAQYTYQRRRMVERILSRSLVLSASACPHRYPSIPGGLSTMNKLKDMHDGRCVIIRGLWFCKNRKRHCFPISSHRPAPLSLKSCPVL